MSITSLILILTGIINLLLAAAVSSRDLRRKSNLFYSLLAVSIAGWSFGMYFFRTVADVQMIWFWGRVVYFCAGLSPFFFLLFSIYFPGNKRSINSAYLFILSIFTLFFSFDSLFGKFIIGGAGSASGVNFLTYNSGNVTYGFYILAYFLLGFLIIASKIKNSNAVVKSQLKLVLLGAFLTLVLSFVNNVILTFYGDFNYNWLGPTSTLILVFFIGYAISRYRLMDIKTLARKSSIFFLLSLIIGALLVLLTSVFSNLLFYVFGFKNDLASNFLVAISVILFFEPLKRILGIFFDKILFSKKYNPSEFLDEVSRVISSTIDLRQLLKIVADKLDAAFHYQKIAFIFLDRADKSAKLNVYYQNGFDMRELSAFASNKAKFLSWYFSDSRDIKVIDELKISYEAGEYEPKSTKLLYDLYGLDVSLIIPLFAKDKMIGLIAFGGKKSNEPYNNADLKVLSVVADQLGIAIENARLYEKQKQFNVKLKEEVKKATAKLEAANKELQRLDDAKSEFLSIASHQLRTPTTIIRGYISMMQEGSFGKVPKVIKENLDKVFIATERLLNLIENLLDISRIEAGRLEFEMGPVDLTKIAEELKEEFSPKADEKKLKISVYYPKGLPIVSADAQKVKEVASNLVDNAIKYTKKGEVSIDLHQEASSVVFVVSDTGMGIASENVGRLFNKFVRGQGMTTVHPEGTGLGLYFARVVIENLGGRIWAESVGKGKGSKFSFSLPLLDKKKAPKIKSSAK